MRLSIPNEKNMLCSICHQALVTKDWLGLFTDSVNLNVHKKSPCEDEASRRLHELDMFSEVETCESSI